MTNVIKFPAIKAAEPKIFETKEDASLEDIFRLEDELDEFKTKFANEMAEILWHRILDELSRSGCNFQDEIEEYFPSMVLVLEAIKSLHLHASGVHHDLQDFAREFIDTDIFDNKYVDIHEDVD